MFLSKLIKFKKIDSTNEYAKYLAKYNKARNNTFILAKVQSAGKTTKKDIKWVSPVGNLHLTSLHKISLSQKKQAYMIGLISAISMMNALVKKFKKYDLDSSIKIKWPNDILIENKKVGGILVEMEGDYVIIGIGLNIAYHPNMTSSSSIKGGIKSACLKDFGLETSPEKIMNIYRKELIKNIKKWKTFGFSYFREIFIQNAFMYGEEISYTSRYGQSIRGKFIDIDENGFLILHEKESGQNSRHISGSF